MSLHKTTLKSAVQKYRGFYDNGDGEAATKAEIAKDSRAFSPEEVDEIYAAILAPAEDEGKEPATNTPPPAAGETGTTSTENTPPAIPNEGNKGTQGNFDDELSKSSDEEQEITFEQAFDDLDFEKGKMIFDALVTKFPELLNAQTGSDDQNKTPGTDQLEINKGDKFVLTIDIRDAGDFNKIHASGTDVSHFDSSRLENLLSKGYVKKV